MKIKYKVMLGLSIVSLCGSALAHNVDHLFPPQPHIVPLPPYVRPPQHDPIFEHNFNNPNIPRIKVYIGNPAAPHGALR